MAAQAFNTATAHDASGCAWNARRLRAIDVQNGHNLGKKPGCYIPTAGVEKLRSCEQTAWTIRNVGTIGSRIRAGTPVGHRPCDHTACTLWDTLHSHPPESVEMTETTAQRCIDARTVVPAAVAPGDVEDQQPILPVVRVQSVAECRDMAALLLSRQEPRVGLRQQACMVDPLQPRQERLIPWEERDDTIAQVLAVQGSTVAQVLAAQGSTVAQELAAQGNTVAQVLAAQEVCLEAEHAEPYMSGSQSWWRRLGIPLDTAAGPL